MKSYMLLILFVLSTFATDHYFLDSTVHEKSRKSSYSYNSDYLVSSDTSFRWDSTQNSWVPFGSYQYNYVNGDKRESIYYRWDTTYSIWKEVRRTLFSYGENPKTYAYITQNWDTTTSNWINVRQSWSKYNSFNKVIETLKSSWDTTQSIWIMTEKENKTYNEREEVIGLIVYENSGTTEQVEWKEDRKYRYDRIYNDADKSVTTTFSIWNSFNGWEPSSRSIWTYDIEGRVVCDQRIEYRDSDSTWINSGISYSAYDAQGNTSKEISAGWDSTTNTWDTTLIVEYLFDLTVPLENIHQPAFGDVTAKLLKKTSLVKESDGVWDEVVWQGCFYSTEIDALISTTKSSQRTLFSIVADRVIFHEGITESTIVHVSNLKGQRVKSYYDIGSSVDMRSLPQGAYVLTILNGEYSMKTKFVKR